MLGARGSQLQLVMNTVFHLDKSPGNLPWSLYQAVKEDTGVELAIPYAVGDNYYGFRIVGTSEEIFTKFEYTKGRKFQTRAGGRFFDQGTLDLGIAVFQGLKARGLRLRHYRDPYLTRKRWRMISATVFTTKVNINKTKAARNNTR